MSFKRHLTAGIALTVGLIALTGSALAAPPSTPPGQEKKEAQQAEQAPAPAAEATIAPAATATLSASAEQNRGQEQKAAKAQSSSGINATTAGVKPSNDTDKSTWCDTGGSGTSTTCTRNPHGTNPPDSSKRYGNGTTAARIATSRGAPAGTDVYGPGNSQPHKVCGKNGHFIDVHAVKTYVGINCSAATTQPQSQSTVTGTTTNTTTTTTTTVTTSANVASTTSQTGSTSGTAAGGVAGVAVESGSPQSGSNGEAGDVLDAFGVAGVAAGGELPFTGFPLWLAILVAIALISVGWTLHRRGRPATRDLV